MFKLRVKNFRGFEDETFDFSRINILIGENSAGKSSILKFLLALKQSLQMPYSQDYNLTLSGNEADLGNYYETIYNHETERNLGFAFEFGEEYIKTYLKFGIESIEEQSMFSDEKKQKYIKNLNTDIKKVNAIRVQYEMNQDLSNHLNINTNFYSELGSFKVNPKFHLLNPQKQKIALADEFPKCDIVFKNSFYNTLLEVINVTYSKKGFITEGIITKDFLVRFNKSHHFKPEDEENQIRLLYQIVFVLSIQDYLNNVLSQIKYINPLLHITEDRIYLKKDRRVIKQIKTIYDFIEFMDSKEATEEYKESLTTLLADFGLADEFYIKKTDSTKELRLKLNGVDNNIKDVGFGVSLQFLIFAQTILSESKGGEVLLIEQPEVHLHPRLQAKFIETLLKIGRHNTYFIETHSEHIIRMLQVLVKKQKYDIKSKDVSIQYFRKDGANMVKSNHKIHPDTGKLQPKFPKGFYDVSYNLAFQLTD